MDLLEPAPLRLSVSAANQAPRQMLYDDSIFV
jgi:hypothetical protein